METKIAILRGINVGGKRIILMSDLKSLCAELGLEEVRTYIQSGNIIFKSTVKNSDLETKIEKSIKAKFGFDVPVIIRTSQELETAADKNPFYKPNSDINKLHLTLLKEKPATENIKQTEMYDYKPDKFVIDDKDIFIFCDGQYHQSKLTNNFFEKKLNVGATTRNWKTVLKLIELSKN